MAVNYLYIYFENRIPIWNELGMRTTAVSLAACHMDAFFSLQ